MKKMLFFINPNAGHSGIRTQLLSILQIFCSAGYDVRVYTTSGPREITRVIEAEGANYDIIVSSGGDGTLNETVAGLLRLEHPPLLGYIPAGTVNDVAASLGLPMDTLEAARNVVGGEPMDLDVGTLNGRAYTYVAAFGAFTEVSYATPQDAKKLLGRLAYLLAGVKSLGEIKPIHARVIAEKDTGSTSSMLTEAVFVRDIKNLLDFNEVAGQVLRIDFSDPKRFLYFQADQVRVEFERDVAWTVDGEAGGLFHTAMLQNHCRAMRVLVPTA